ncbi:hypothetical protein D3C73_1456450 [compost metagenome]
MAIEPDCRFVEPFFGIALAAHDFAGLGEDFGKLPHPPALFDAERLAGIGTTSLQGTHAHADGLFEGHGIEHCQLALEVSQRLPRQAS